MKYIHLSCLIFGCVSLWGCERYIENPHHHKSGKKQKIIYVDNNAESRVRMPASPSSQPNSTEEVK